MSKQACKTLLAQMSQIVCIAACVQYNTSFLHASSLRPPGPFLLWTLSVCEVSGLHIEKHSE